MQLRQPSRSSQPRLRRLVQRFARANPPATRRVLHEAAAILRQGEPRRLAPGCWHIPCLPICGCWGRGHRLIARLRCGCRWGRGRRPCVHGMVALLWILSLPRAQRAAETRELAWWVSQRVPAATWYVVTRFFL